MMTLSRSQSELAALVDSSQCSPTGGSSNKPWAVIKYGGTSVSSVACWGSITARCKELASTHRVCIVASAISQVTNLLGAAVDQALQGIQQMPALQSIVSKHQTLAEELGIPIDGDAYAPVAQLLQDLERLLDGIRLTEEASPRVRARVSAFGELASTHLGVAALRYVGGLECTRVDARRVLISTPARGEAESDRYLNAKIVPFTQPSAVTAECGAAQLIITQGFIGRTPSDETCLLGRGGSDTSASLFAGVLKADFLEIWTDVHGLYTCDPRIIPEARLLRTINYREAQELAAMGAKVLHPKCLRPAEEASVPVAIRMTSDPETPGTTISANESKTPAVMAVVHRMNVTLMTISSLQMWQEVGFMQRVFGPFKDLGMSIDLVATSQSAISITLDHIPGGVDGKAFLDLQAMLEDIAGPFGVLEVRHGMAAVSIVGRQLRKLLPRIGIALAELPSDLDVALISESSEDLNFSLVVNNDDAVPLVKVLHQQLISLQGIDELLGPSWSILKAAIKARGGADAKHLRGASSPPLTGQNQIVWWTKKQDQLMAAIGNEPGIYVYHLETIQNRARELQLSCPQLSTFTFPLCINSHCDVLKALAAEGFKIECVDIHEVQQAVQLLNNHGSAIIFAPNFCDKADFMEAYRLGAEVVVNSIKAFSEHPESFEGRDVTLKVDPTCAQSSASFHHAQGSIRLSHHLEDMASLSAAAENAGAVVVGLQVRCRHGPSMRESILWWADSVQVAAEALPALRFVDIEADLGGVRIGALEALQDELANFCKWAEAAGLQVRFQQGDFVLRGAGILLAQVKDVQESGGTRYICIAPGTNEGHVVARSFQTIVNLSHEVAVAGDETMIETYAHVVEHAMGHQIGVQIVARDQCLPKTSRGDVLLMSNAWKSGQIRQTCDTAPKIREEVI